MLISTRYVRFSNFAVFSVSKHRGLGTRLRCRDALRGYE